MRQVIFWLATVIVFTVPNYMIWQKERLRKSSSTVLLQLAPVDPRSLIQGDYMILDYAVNRSLSRQNPKPPKDGFVVLTLDKNRVGSFVRIHSSKIKLTKSEMLIQYRYRKRRYRVGANAFFFQEGHAKFYDKARYGEYRVTPSGKSLLIGLRTPDFKIIKPPSRIIKQPKK